jgi:hypothetical protein
MLYRASMSPHSLLIILPATATRSIPIIILLSYPARRLPPLHSNRHSLSRSQKLAREAQQLRVELPITPGPCQPKLPVLESRYLVTYSAPQVTLLNQIPQVHARTSPLCSTLPCPDTFYLASPCRGTLNRIPMATCPRYQPTDF